MDIEGLSIGMSQSQLMLNISTAILAKSLDTLETSGENMVKMMELSVNPNLGSQLDISV